MLEEEKKNNVGHLYSKREIKCNKRKYFIDPRTRKIFKKCIEEHLEKNEKLFRLNFDQFHFILS